MPNADLNELLELLESVTDDIHLSILNESSDDDDDGGSSDISLRKVIDTSIKEVRAISDSMKEFSGIRDITNDNLVDTFKERHISAENNKDIDPDGGDELSGFGAKKYDVPTFSNLTKEISDVYGKPNNASFDYALNEIKKHSNNPESSFPKSAVVAGAIGAGSKFYIGSDCSTIAEFKTKLYDKILGSSRRVPLQIIPNRTKIVNNYRKAKILSKKIDNILIRQHISSLTKYQTSLLKEFKKAEFKSKKFYKFIPDYMDVISDVISNTHSMYSIMEGVFNVFASECTRVMRETIRENGGSSSKNESAYVKDIANFINSYTKPIKDIYNQSLNEDVTLQSDLLLNKSESLNTLRERFNSESLGCHLKRVDEINRYQKQIGPLLNSFNFDSISPNFTYEAYTNINMMFDSNELLEKLKSNIDFVDDVLKQYNNNSNFQVNDFITKVLPKGLLCCVPDANANNFLGTTLVNISPKICGQKEYIKPDIYEVSRNMINIPIVLKAIDDHISNLNMLIEKSFSLIPTGQKVGQTHSMVYNITNAFYAYLAIILSIYNSYDRLMQSSIDMVTAISKSINDDY